MGRLQTDMDLSAGWIAVIAGTICGIISGFGVGGGSLLMVWMTAVIAINQKTAQGINLLYFLPTSVAALIFHIKNKQKLVLLRRLSDTLKIYRCPLLLICNSFTRNKFIFSTIGYCRHNS